MTQPPLSCLTVAVLSGQPWTLSIAGAVAAALCTALRCLESVAARESVLPLPDHQVASILAVPGTLFGAGAGAAATASSGALLSHGHEGRRLASPWRQLTMC